MPPTVTMWPDPPVTTTPPPPPDEGRRPADVSAARQDAAKALLAAPEPLQHKGNPFEGALFSECPACMGIDRSAGEWWKNPYGIVGECE